MTTSVDSLHPLVLNVGLAIHNGDWNWQNVSSPFSRIYYVVEGTAQVVLPTGIVSLTPGHLYIIPAFTRHSYICHDHFVHYYIHIYEEINADGSALLTENWNFPTELKATQMDRMLFERLCEANPTMKLQQSDPTTYDNESTLMENVINNRQRTFSLKVESRGIVLQLLARFLETASQLNKY